MEESNPLYIYARYGWRLCRAFVSLTRLSFSPVPQLNSQPASHAMNTPLFLPFSLQFCLPQSHSPSMPEALTVPMSPSYANCLSCYQQCMSVWWASLARLSVCCSARPVSPSILPPVPRLSAMLHLSDCMPTIVFHQYLCGRKHPSCWLLCQFALSACSFCISLRHYYCFFMYQSWPSAFYCVICLAVKLCTLFSDPFRSACDNLSTQN